MKNVAIAILLVMSVGVSPTSHATVYRWVHKNGNVVYQDQPPPAGAAQVQVRSMDEVPASGRDAASGASAKHPVTLYTVPHCDSCDLARAYLKQRGVPFREVNVATDPKAQQEMRKAAGDLSVPTITVGSKVIQGFAQTQLSAALDHVGYSKTKSSSDGASP